MCGSAGTVKAADAHGAERPASVMYDFVKTLSLPPASLVLILLLGLLMRRRARRAGTVLAGVAVLALYLASVPFVASRLLVAVEAGLEAPGQSQLTPQAIVILSAGFSHADAHGEAVNVDPATLERLRHGVRLHRSTGLPVLVTGGGAEGRPTMATLMDRTLRDDFGVTPQWIEKRAASTYENARYSAQLLSDEGITSVMLVSQAWHMPRALAAFRAAGLAVTPSPSSYSRPSKRHVMAFIPTANAMHGSFLAIHEFLGLLYYRWVLFDAE